ncbi:vitamin K epoxide reductase family protein [Candidatus Uhrbacteria bacterium]|nr:vitamin K epoxide reductase family protein [Candidatus Uhrbacteria bacterium]
MMSALFLVIGFSLVGFAISYYIFRTKEAGKKLVCPIGEDCNAVVHSAYSKLFGVPNEIVGMLYYGFVILMSGLIWSGVPAILGAKPVIILFVIGLGAGVMSVILTGIQAFVLRAWCFYCLASAAINIAIVVVEWRLR